MQFKYDHVWHTHTFWNRNEVVHWIIHYITCYCDIFATDVSKCLAILFAISKTLRDYLESFDETSSPDSGFVVIVVDSNFGFVAYWAT